MNFLHYEFDLDAADIIEITLDKQANVRLLDDSNYAAYKAGRAYSAHGVLAKVSPLRVSPPHGGHWNLVIDLGGYAGKVKAAVRTIKS